MSKVKREGSFKGHNKFKGLVHPEILILSLMNHPHIVQSP